MRYTATRWSVMWGASRLEAGAKPRSTQQLGLTLLRLAVAEGLDCDWGHALQCR